MFTPRKSEAESRPGARSVGRSRHLLKAAWGCRTPKPRGRSGVRFLLPLSLLCCITSFGEDYDPSRFEKEIIVPACVDAVQCEVTADGRVFFIERAGAL